MKLRSVVASLLVVALGDSAAFADVVRIDIRQRLDQGGYERLVGRAYFAIDPALDANRAIADLALAPRNASGLVEFSSDFLVVRPRNTRRANGTVFLEVVNRGREQSLGLLSGARHRGTSVDDWDLGDRFVLERGFTLAFLGWQFDVAPERGLGLQAPSVPVRGVVRGSAVVTGTDLRSNGFGLPYCAANPSQSDARVTRRARIEDPPTLLPREAWQFSANGCAVVVDAGLERGLYEAIYDTTGSPMAGLGLAAIRDFAAYLKHGPSGAPLRDAPALVERVLGFGYSQSGRLLREFVRDGFNVSERGQLVFDGLLIAAAGAGGGSFNHRFAMPGVAGNSVLSILRPVDLPPFTDDHLLAKARDARATPKIFYTFSSSEYWARAGSLTHSTEDGRTDVPLADTSRLYFLAGTPHAAGPFPPARSPTVRHELNFAEQRWALRALVVALEAWIHAGVEPPPSRYPTIARKELVAREAVSFPTIPALPLAPYVPPVWHMDFGAGFPTSRVIAHEPPVLGSPYPVLVPQVDADGHDLGGVRLPDVAVPLGTFTGWNESVPPVPDLRYLAGLLGSFQPFARTRAEQNLTRDARASIAERYADRRDYLARVQQAITALVRQRFLLADDATPVLRRAEHLWALVVGDE